MLQLPAALAPLGAFKQFILCKLVPSTKKPGKMEKLPIDWQSGQVVSAHDPRIWIDAQTAFMLAAQYGPSYLPCFVFTKSDPFWFLDIDACRVAADGSWSPLAQHLVSLFPGAAVEVSTSGIGLHIFGTGECPPHRVRPPTEIDQRFPGLEFYTDGRFVALTGNMLGDGSAGTPFNMPAFVETWFKPSPKSAPAEWTDAPCAEWRGPTDDDELIRRARNSKSGANAFGNKASFDDLWTANEEVLAKAFPDNQWPYDASKADSALAQHLAFWTGRDCERIERLMRQSALARPKWDQHETYLGKLTILGVVARQHQVLQDKPPEMPQLAQLPPGYVAPQVSYSAPAGPIYGPPITPGVSLAPAPVSAPNLVHQIAACEPPVQAQAAPMFDEDGEPICVPVAGPGVAAGAPAAAAPAEDGTPRYERAEMRRVTGSTWLNVDEQLTLFTGCVYISSLDRALIPGGRIVNGSKFKVIYGGHTFVMDKENRKLSTDAWEAFTQSQLMRPPVADATCFRPDLPPSDVVSAAGVREANIWWPVVTPRKPGNVDIFLAHCAKLFTDEIDRRKLLSYMAAMIQYPGVKFMWAPLIQGVEGNGKTILSLVVAKALGARYVHWPAADKLKSNFNGWLQNKLAYLIEDIYLPNSEADVLEKLKPMITSTEGYEVESKGVDTASVRITGNFLFNTNHKGGIPKTANDRRIAPFHCAQQVKADLARDGMGREYFRHLYYWLEKMDGYAAVHDWLATFAIEDAFNPALGGIAPITTSTAAALEFGRGAMEQEILEAIGQEAPGFCGGWLSSLALERRFENNGRWKALSYARRWQILEGLGYVQHPHLTDGRVNNPVLPDGGRTRLFVHQDCGSIKLTSPGEIAKAYSSAQPGGNPAILPK